MLDSPTMEGDGDASSIPSLGKWFETSLLFGTALPKGCSPLSLQASLDEGHVLTKSTLSLIVRPFNSQPRRFYVEASHRSCRTSTTMPSNVYFKPRTKPFSNLEGKVPSTYAVSFKHPSQASLLATLHPVHLRWWASISWYMGVIVPTSGWQSACDLAAKYEACDVQSRGACILERSVRIDVRGGTWAAFQNDRGQGNDTIPCVPGL
ncbi:hypothetical protein FPV67DRAFT_1118481 [Lyophyllum atratum]|nr:hypothetical protein FPV67DRAFT_1118481 [Lyophyllum atratum]